MSSSDRLAYQDATVLDQSFLDESHDNLTSQIRMVAEIETPTGTIYASNQNIYVGTTFYEALLSFPNVGRTLGDWLSSTLEFSTISLDLSNVDGRFNSLLPSGADFNSWIGKTVTIKLGIREEAATYFKIFEGKVTEIGGFERTVSTIKVIARDKFDELSASFPVNVLDETTYPDIEDNKVGLVKPVIYGDWTTQVTPGSASIPSFPVNGLKATVLTGNANLELVTSDNNLSLFDVASVFLLRGNTLEVFDSGDIVNVAVGNNAFEIRQEFSGSTTVLASGDKYIFTSSDNFFVKVKGKDLGVYDDNIVEQARDILVTYTNAVVGDFDATWNTFRDKSTPAESDISTTKSRVWIQSPQAAMEFILSLLEQVRLEAFISRDLKIKINSLHLDDFIASPSFSMRNWDVEKGSFSPKLDTRNNFNRANANYNFLPNKDENALLTPFFRNSASITQVGKEISKTVVFPNLYEAVTVELQIQEFIKLASSYFEVIDVNLTWRSLLLDLGDFVKINVNIGASNFVDIPAMIRTVNYDPNGFRIPLKLWSFQVVPFTGHSPSGGGVVGGSTAVITQE